MRSRNRSTVRKTRSFSLDQSVLAELERTKGSASASERVNELLKYAFETERKANLYEEAAEFFKTSQQERRERNAFQKASLKSWSRK